MTNHIGGINDIYAFDEAIRQQGYTPIAGVDEAGRGPLAGPVYVAAVILDPSREIEGLTDSKKLTEKKREKLFDHICSTAIAYHIEFATVDEIEQYNIWGATSLAMCRAVAALQVVPALALIDGNLTPEGMPVPTRTVVKGDNLSASIAAASILAKVSRDRYMKILDPQFPAYGFANHKGYGTAAHIAAIREHGVLPIHRKSFLKKIV